VYLKLRIYETILFKTSFETIDLSDMTLTDISEISDGGCIPSFTWTQRLYGFVGCFFCGGLMSILSSVSLVRGKLSTFASLYTLGNFISIVSTGFLHGPRRQCTSMFHKTRVVATCVYLFCMVSTLIVVGIPSKKRAKTGVCISLVLLQFMALTWYCLSYIPFARQVVKHCLQVV